MLIKLELPQSIHELTKMKASLFLVQLLFTTHIEKADSLSEWMPLLQREARKV